MYLSIACSKLLTSYSLPPTDRAILLRAVAYWKAKDKIWCSKHIGNTRDITLLL